MGNMLYFGLKIKKGPEILRPFVYGALPRFIVAGFEPAAYPFVRGSL